MSEISAHTVLVHPHPLGREAVAGWLKEYSSVRLVATVPDLLSLEHLSYFSDVELVTLFVYEPNDIAGQIIHLKQVNSLLKFLILTAREMSRSVHDFVRAGTNALIELVSEVDEWDRAIKAVSRGQFYYSHTVMLALADASYVAVGQSSVKTRNMLSKRELEILAMVANEYSTSQIAIELAISGKTVEAHRRSLSQKLDVKNVVGLTRAAVRLGLI